MYKHLMATFCFLVFSTTVGAQPKPIISRVAELSLGEIGSIDIHRSAQGDGSVNRENIYFHEPAFVLLESEKTLPHHDEGWPLIVQVLEQTQSGRTKFQFKVLDSSPEIRRQAEDLLRQPAPIGDAVWIDTREIDPNTVSVLAWPTNTVRLSLVKEFEDGTVFGTAQKKLIKKEKETGVWTVQVEVDPGNLQEFKESLLDGTALFQFDISYDGQEEKSASASTQYTISAVETVSNFLTAKQKPENGPIFQEELQEMIALLEESTVTTIQTTDEALIAHTYQKWDETLISSSGLLSDFTDPQPELLQSVDSYLQRLVDTIVTEQTTTDTTTETDETNTKLVLRGKGSISDTMGTKISSDGGASATSSSGTGLEGEITLTKEWKDKVQRVYGVVLKTTETEHQVVPADIKVNFLSSSWRQAVRKRTSYVFVGSPIESGFGFSTTVDTNRRALESSFLIQPSVSSARVPLGAAMCYFGEGEEAPKGFAFLETGYTWPEAPWVAASQRGVTLPSTEDLLFGTAASMDEVGTIWRKGQFTLGPIDIPGSAFHPNGQAVFGMSATQVVGPNSQPQLPQGPGGASFSALNTRYWGSNPPPTRTLPTRSIRHVLVGYTEQTSPNPDDPLIVHSTTLVKPVTFKSPSTMAGTHTIPARTIDLSGLATMPNHIKCRWIVRVQ